MHFRAPRTFLIPLILLAALPAGCKRDEAPDPAGALKQLGAELEDTRQKLAAAEKALAVRNDDVAVATAADMADEDGIAVALGELAGEGITAQ